VTPDIGEVNFTLASDPAHPSGTVSIRTIARPSSATAEALNPRSRTGYWVFLTCTAGFFQQSWQKHLYVWFAVHPIIGEHLTPQQYLAVYMPWYGPTVEGNELSTNCWHHGKRRVE
jgi:hypothetical protein